MTSPTRWSRYARRPPMPFLGFPHLSTSHSSALSCSVAIERLISQRLHSRSKSSWHLNGNTGDDGAP
eukprot:5369949-Pyramimonas_sp.AAC.1